VQVGEREGAESLRRRGKVMGKKENNDLNRSREVLPSNAFDCA
jgi:hypothetical protein